MNREAISRKEMIDADKRAINFYKIPSIVLMENAAMAFFSEVKDMYHKFVVVSSCGNNGGDGLAIARHLYIRGREVKVYIAGNPDKMTEDCRINYEILKNLEVPINFLEEDKLDKFSEAIRDYFLVDAIFGTGLSREVQGFYKELIEKINLCSKATLSVDIPSGINADTGEVMGAAIKASETITFHKIKKGLLKAPRYTGVLKVRYIGIPNK